MTIAALASISFLVKVTCDLTTSMGVGRDVGVGHVREAVLDEVDALGDVLDDRALGLLDEVEDLVLVVLDGGEEVAHEVLLGGWGGGEALR